MEQSSSTPSTGSAARGAGATRAGTLAMVAGALFLVSPLVELTGHWAWPVLLAGFALLVLVVPPLHRYQAPADGWAGRAGSWLVVGGAAGFAALSLLSAAWVLASDSAMDQPDWAAALWWLASSAYLGGIVASCAGSIAAGLLPRGAPALVLAGLLTALVVDRAAGTDAQDGAGSPEWGLYTGIPLFGLGLLWLGSALRRGTRGVRRAAGATAVQ
jgi:hypothetical protein